MSRGAQRVEGVPVRTVAAGGTTLAYLDVGAGPTILLVPGFTGSKEDFGPLLAPLAAAGYRAIALDLRGQLDSPGGGLTPSYAPDGLAADLLAFVDALRLAPVHLVGHSYGGLVSRAAVLATPAPFASLTLLCSGPAGIGGGRARVMNRLRRDLTEGGTERVGALLRAAGGTGFEAERFEASDPAALLGMGEALLSEPDRVAELAAVLAAQDIPVLVACGADDDAWPPALQQVMADRLAAPFELVAGAGHSPAIDQPAATSALVVRFVSAAAGPASGHAGLARGH